MSETKRKKGLGRGLSSLLDDVSESAKATTGSGRAVTSGSELVAIDLIRPNPDQPRRTFPVAEMNDLVSSIREKGVLQPLLVRPDPDRPGSWTIVAGERRWRAAQMAELHELPIVARDFTDEEMLEVAIIENVQRADLNAMEEAQAYRQLMDRFGHTQEVLAKAVGKSRPYIANALRLLALPDSVQEMVASGQLTAGHARAIATSANPAELARQVINRGLSVRQAEDLARQVAVPRTKLRQRARKDADTQVLENDLSAALSMKVAIAHKGKGGAVTINYKDLDQLDGLCQLLMRD
ncbi:MAG: ParB/RepB/Spo0J family partition protein [Pseudomonadota bacterium]